MRDDQAGVFDARVHDPNSPYVMDCRGCGTRFITRRIKDWGTEHLKCPKCEHYWIVIVSRVP